MTQEKMVGDSQRDILHVFFKCVT